MKTYSVKQIHIEKMRLYMEKLNKNNKDNKDKKNDDTNNK